MSRIRVFVFEKLGLLKVINWVLEPNGEVMVRKPEKPRIIRSNERYD
jgi:hypothetical protein